MTAVSPSRRRFIGISAAAAGFALLPVRGMRSAAGPAPDDHLRHWRGIALGADAVLQIHHPDPAQAELLIRRSVAEVRRLERVFSLYRADSALSALNRAGVLREPPADLIRLLAEADRFSRVTAGAFDATVQPLWQVYARHFAAPDADPGGPARAQCEAALSRIGYGRVEIEANVVRFARPQMALTLNGIAQGYITDRVTDLLLDAGVAHALVDMGEIRALGGRPSGEAWRVGLEDPLHPGTIAETVAVRQLAVATSGGYGTEFDSAGRFNHILDPRTGATSTRYAGVSVLAPQATMADALSTAFMLMPLEATQQIVRAYGISAHFALPKGRRVIQTA